MGCEGFCGATSWRRHGDGARGEAEDGDRLEGGGDGVCAGVGVQHDAGGGGEDVQDNSGVEHPRGGAEDVQGDGGGSGQRGHGVRADHSDTRPL